MQRIDAHASGMRGLSAVLPSTTKPAAPVETVPQGGTVPSIDPALELQALREAATREGHAKGMADAGNQIAAAVAQAREKLEREHAGRMEELAAVRARLEALVLGLEQVAKDVHDEVAAIAVEVGFLSMTRLLGALDDGQAIILGICRQALDEFAHRPAVLRVSPGDERLLGEARLGEGVRIEADPGLRDGSCRIETHKGAYETGVAERLERLKQALLAVVPEGRR